MSKTLNLNKVSKAQRARNKWAQLQEEIKKERILEQLKTLSKDRTNGNVKKQNKNTSKAS